MQITSPKCPNCGAGILDPNAKFCAHCGSAIVVSNASQSQPTVASLLEVGKSMLTAGGDAKKQFMLVLQMEPDNKEAWFWHGVCMNDPESIKTSWEKSGFARAQIVSSLANMFTGKHLLLHFWSIYFFNSPRILGYEAQATIFLDATFQAQREPQSRKDILDRFDSILSDLSNALRGFYLNESLKRVSFRESEQERVRDCCTGLAMLLDRLGADQSGDVVEGTIVSKGGGFFGGYYSERRVREKPSYWRKYIQQVLAQLPK